MAEKEVPDSINSEVPDSVNEWQDGHKEQRGQNNDMAGSDLNSRGVNAVDAHVEDQHRIRRINHS